MARSSREEGVAGIGEFGAFRRVPSQRKDYVSRAYRSGPYTRCDELWDFTGEAPITELSSVFVNSASNADLVQLGGSSAVSRAYFRVPRAGIVTGISFFGEDGITQHGTNFQTFTALNLQTAGDGNRALLDTTANVNTTNTNAAALNGGTNLTAKVEYALALTATTASLYVKEGDIIEVTATADGTGAVVDNARAILKIKSIAGLKPTVTHTGGATTNVPIATQNANTANGSALLQLSATNEVQNVRLDLGDQLIIPATRRPRFEARITIPTVTTAQALVIGLASAFNATFDSTTTNLWFKYAAALTPVIEGDDGTTDTDDKVTGVTSVTATSYLYTIDASDLTQVKFWIDENYVGSVAVSALTVSSLLQPVVWLQKASGTGTIAVNVDYVRVQFDRF